MWSDFVGLFFFFTGRQIFLSKQRTNFFSFSSFFSNARVFLLSRRFNTRLRSKFDPLETQYWTALLKRKKRKKGTCIIDDTVLGIFRIFRTIFGHAFKRSEKCWSGVSGDGRGRDILRILKSSNGKKHHSIFNVFANPSNSLDNRPSRFPSSSSSSVVVVSSSTFYFRQSKNPRCSPRFSIPDLPIIPQQLWNSILN